MTWRTRGAGCGPSSVSWSSPARSSAAGRSVRDEHVGAVDQLGRELAGRRRCEGSSATLRLLRLSSSNGGFDSSTPTRRRADAAERIAVGRLDLHDVGAPVAEDRRSRGAGHPHPDLDDAEPLERSSHDGTVERHPEGRAWSVTPGRSFRTSRSQPYPASMRIGLTGGASTVERMVEQAEQAEADGFASLWYASAVGGDPLVGDGVRRPGDATIELGTSVLQTYTCHPVLQANRAASAAAAMGRPGLHARRRSVAPAGDRGRVRLSYATPGRHTEEYVRVARRRCCAARRSTSTARIRVHLDGRAAPPPTRCRVLIARSRRACCASPASSPTARSSGWATPGRSRRHVAPRINAAAADAGRPAPRIVAGLPGRGARRRGRGPRAAAAAVRRLRHAAELPAHPRHRRRRRAGRRGDRRRRGVGRRAGPRRSFDAGATDVWAAPFPVGADRRASRQRTVDLLRTLL